MKYKKNRLRFFSLAASLCFLLSTLSSCGNSMLPEFTETNSYFHLSETPFFPAYFAMQGDWLLEDQEISEFGACRLVMFSVDGSRKYVLKRDPFISFEYGYNLLSIIGDNIYYSANYPVDAHRFHQYNIRTHKDKVIVNTSPRDYCVDENNVFLVIASDGHYSLLRYGVADNSRSWIYDFDYDQMYLSRYALYYVLNNIVYRLDLYSDTYEPEQVIRLDSDMQVDQLAVDDGDIYINTGDAVVCFPSGENEAHIILERGNIEAFSISQGKIIFESDDTPDGSSVKEIKLLVYDLTTEKTNEIFSDERWIQYDVFDDKILVRDNHYEQQPRYSTVNIYDLSGDLISTCDWYV